jgi:capsular polysaccharide biosynthesis protein
MMDYENQAQEIDLRTLFRILIQKWWLIGAITFLGFGLAFIYAYLYVDSEYTADVSMMVLVSNEEQTNEQNFNFSSKLKSTYTELAKSDLVINRVIDELNLYYSPNQLRDMITVNAVQDTIIIKLTVVTNYPYNSYAIANKIVDVMKDVSQNFEGFDNIEVLDRAVEPTTPSGPNRLLYVLIGTMLGGIIGVGLVFVIEFMDQTIKTTDDIENKLKLRVLATIPDYDMTEEAID